MCNPLPYEFCLHQYKLLRLLTPHASNARSFCSPLTIRQNCPALSAMPLVSLPTGVQRLRMENCPRVDDRLPQYLVPAVLQQLQLLSLTGCCNLTDDSMCVLVTELSRVADLSLRECYIITDASLQVLGRSRRGRRKKETRLRLLKLRCLREHCVASLGIYSTLKQKFALTLHGTLGTAP